MSEVSSVTRLRWESAAMPPPGMVLDNFPRDGYSVVESVEDDPEAMWEMAYWGNEIPEYRPKSVIVTLRPATESEVNQERERYENAARPIKTSLLERLFS